VQQELQKIRCGDALRQFHVFLLNNDQRWHLFDLYENVDIYRVEMQLPFFDGAFLASILSVPAERCLGHRYYHKWLSLFPETVRTVPWQAYPGHEPCPLPLPVHLSSQWSPSVLRQTAKLRRQELITKGRRVLTAFPSTILDKNRFRAAFLLFRAGVRDYGYVVNAAWMFQKYWAVSGGDIAPL
jgi:hypothetical protein